MVACQTQIVQWLFFLVASLCVAADQIMSDYVFVQTPVSWVTAREFCRRHYVDMAVLSTEEQYFSMLNATASSMDSFWLGLRRRDVSSGWTWVSGQELTYKRWYVKDYEGRCATLDAMLGREHKLLARLCDERHMIVCQGPVSPQSLAVSTTSADLLTLSWNVPPLMQTTPHRYHVKFCSSTCGTVVSSCPNGSSSMTVSVPNVPSATEYSVSVAAVVERPNHLTGRDVTLQSDPATIRIPKAVPSFTRISPMFLRVLKLLLFAFLLFLLLLLYHMGIRGVDSLEIKGCIPPPFLSCMDTEVIIKSAATV